MASNVCVSSASASGKLIGLFEIPFFDPLQTAESGLVGTVAHFSDTYFYGSKVPKPCKPATKDPCLPPKRD